MRALRRRSVHTLRLYESAHLGARDHRASRRPLGHACAYFFDCVQQGVQQGCGFGQPAAVKHEIRTEAAKIGLHLCTSHGRGLRGLGDDLFVIMQYTEVKKNANVPCLAAVQAAPPPLASFRAPWCRGVLPVQSVETTRKYMPQAQHAGCG